MTNRDARVAGESAALVLAAVADRTVKPTQDGMARIAFSVRADSAEGTALARAYARTFGRLAGQDLLEELRTGVRPRSERQRKADALVQLLHDAAEALAATPSPAPTSFRQMPTTRN